MLGTADKPEMERRDAAMALDSFEELDDLSQDVMIPLDGARKTILTIRTIASEPFTARGTCRTRHMILISP